METDAAAAELRAARFRNAFLLLLVVSISAAFLATIRSFLMALLLAALFTGLTRPLYLKLVGWMRGRRSAASAATLLLVLFLIVVPLLGLMGIVAAQAVQVSETVSPWLTEHVADESGRAELLQRLEIPDWIEPYQSQILSKAGELASRAGGFVVSALAEATRGTASFLFQLVVMLYAMFFFLRDGHVVLEQILHYSPLATEDEDRLVERFVSVTRATIKGTFVIGILQGALAGIAFAVVGIDSAVFWGTIMAVLSIIPGVGTALVWVPAAVYLFATGQTLAAAGLTAWCVLAVGTVDNFLRPTLVGKDTQMPDLLIFLSTLGGIVVFGAVGILVGPLVAALFLTVWDLYGAHFAHVLPQRPAAGTS